MSFLERKYRSTRKQKEQGRKIALNHGLPKILRELPPGIHSYERRFIITRVLGYKTVYESINTYKIVLKDKKFLEKECLKLGIIPVFKGNYISLDSFPRKSIIKEEIISEAFRDGLKTIEKKSYFDILEYISRN
jgi:hypothetical protein